MVEHQRARPEGGDRVGDAPPRDVEGRAVDRLEHRGKAAARIEIGGRRDAQAAGESRREIAENVGMQVGRDDRIDRLRLQHHARRHRVDEFLVDADFGIVLADERGDLVPEHHAVALRVRFGDDREMPPRPRPRHIEGEAHDALDADAGEDCRLGRHLLGQAAMDAPAVAGIFALAVLADDDPVEIGGAASGKRAGDPRQDACRPQIGVLIETLADRQAQAPERDMVGDLLVADGAEIDGVELAQGGKPVLRHHPAVLAVVVGTPGEILDGEAEAAVALLDDAHDLEPGGDHFLANAVRRYGGDPVFTHGMSGPCLVGSVTGSGTPRTRAFDYAQDEARFPSAPHLILSVVEGYGRGTHSAALRGRATGADRATARRRAGRGETRRSSPSR
jgi:hypothetical protein